MRKKAEKIELYDKAVQSYLAGQFPSIRKASQHFGLCYNTLYNKIFTGEKYTGSGRKSQVFTPEEEQKIVTFLLDVSSRGCVFTFAQLSLLIQELMISVVTSNPTRTGPWEENGHFPNKSYVSRFIKRHGLTLRSTMELSKARALLTTVDLEAWFSDFIGGLVNNPKFSPCFS